MVEVGANGAATSTVFNGVDAATFEDVGGNVVGLVGALLEPLIDEVVYETR